MPTPNRPAAVALAATLAGGAGFAGSALRAQYFPVGELPPVVPAELDCRNEDGQNVCRQRLTMPAAAAPGALPSSWACRHVDSKTPHVDAERGSCSGCLCSPVFDAAPVEAADGGVR